MGEEALRVKGSEGIPDGSVFPEQVEQLLGSYVVAARTLVICGSDEAGTAAAYLRFLTNKALWKVMVSQGIRSGRRGACWMDEQRGRPKESQAGGPRSCGE